ncbi:MAG: helix-turn-helix domain-containing protein [Chloroflexi bacterium]|nr:helix-turn-helix domain-containing protein [Chloroflexota bacterium]
MAVLDWRLAAVLGRRGRADGRRGESLRGANEVSTGKTAEAKRVLTSPRISDDEILFDLSETMDYLRVSRSTIYRLMKAGHLIGHKVGRKWVFYKRDVRALVEEFPIAIGASSSM